jgi:hypothetical protein
MSLASLTKWYVHINKFGIAAGRVVGSKDLCDPYLKYEVLVKFEEAAEAFSNRLQQLKSEIDYLAGSIESALERKSDVDIRFIVHKLRQLSAVLSEAI